MNYRTSIILKESLWQLFSNSVNVEPNSRLAMGSGHFPNLVLKHIAYVASFEDSMLDCVNY